MRIIGGDLSGRKVAVPPGEIRPIMDKMRESLFTILGSIRDRPFLDLFAGSAIVGLEAYSRGARPVVCVEKDGRKRTVIRTNLANLIPPVELRIEPVERFVQRNSRPFEIVYVDPPFAYRFREDLLKRLARSRTVAADTVVAIHVPKSAPLPDRIGSLHVGDQRRFGGSLLYFLWQE